MHKWFKSRLGDIAYFKYHYRLPFVVLTLLLCAVLVTGVVFAATQVSNTWWSPKIEVTSPPPPPPPDNSPLVLSSPTLGEFTGTESVGVYVGSWLEGDVRLQNPSALGAPGYAGVRVQFLIHKWGTPAPSEIVLEYLDPGDSLWKAIPTVYDVDSDALMGYFGPPEGFAVGYGYDVTTQLRLKSLVAATWQIEAFVLQGS